MRLYKAVFYFFREAVVSLGRSWKVSALAIATIAMSLFVAGLFLLISNNLRGVAGRWQQQARILVYLEDTAGEEQRKEILRRIEAESWVEGMDWISSERAEDRFREFFPSLGSLMEGWGERPLPGSFEITVDREAVSNDSLQVWLETVRDAPGVAMIDDDMDWLEDLGRLIMMLRAGGLVVGSILVVAAIFTISSVIRLTAFLYADEIAIMRLVGATELYIRGPFYVEGLLQGIVGGVLASGVLTAGHHLLLTREQSSLLFSLFLGEFLLPAQLVLLVVFGGVAGLVGATLSLRRETEEIEVSQ